MHHTFVCMREPHARILLAARSRGMRCKRALHAAELGRSAVGANIQGESVAVYAAAIKHGILP